MRSSSLVLAAGSLASVAVAASSPGFIFPASVPLAKRQVSGPAYECHSDCGKPLGHLVPVLGHHTNPFIGYAILNASGDYCTDSAWLDLLDGCLNCALEYNIWQVSSRQR